MNIVVLAKNLAFRNNSFRSIEGYRLQSLIRNTDKALQAYGIAFSFQFVYLQVVFEPPLSPANN